MKRLSLVVGVVAMFAVSLSAQRTPSQIESEYQSVSADLQKHVTDNVWMVDDAPETLSLGARQQVIAGDWVAAWLNLHPFATCEAITSALAEFEGRRCLRLGEDAYAVEAPSATGNVFIVARQVGRYRLAWSTALVQASTGKQAEILSAWRMEKMREEEKSDSQEKWWTHGPMIFNGLGKLPDDAKGDARFYIQGEYPGEGGTIGEQISLWAWDGTTARPLVARYYTIMIDQKVGTRLEGDLLKVQQKNSFRTFFSCGSCEERQTDWVLRIAPDGVQEIGETSMVPELDAADELFFRIIHGGNAADIASSSAVKSAQSIVKEARSAHTEEAWEKFPSLGMMGEWKVANDAHGNTALSLSLDGADFPLLITLRSRGGRLFIADIQEIQKPCEKY